ncbi:MAG: hypothetical protein RBT63_04055 [Bdellovibrionales bacterium]|jgi:hypothetical protein|nr:hypothetical protein [Bdellovibrionales bacterium]
MSEPIVRKRFHPASRRTIDLMVPDTDWNSWQWQLAHAQDILLTPYYRSLASENQIRYDEAVAKSHSSLLNEPIYDSLSVTNETLQTFTHTTDNPIYLDTHAVSRLPQRIESGLIEALKKFDQVVINTQFQHPDECTVQAFDAASALANTGVILSNRTTLLRGVNDDPETIKELNHRLLMMRIRPYCFFSADPISETLGLAVPPQRGIEILDTLRGWTSGLAVPHHIALNVAGGKAYIPNYIRKKEGDVYVFRNYRNQEYRYEDS